MYLGSLSGSIIIGLVSRLPGDVNDERVPSYAGNAVIWVPAHKLRLPVHWCTGDALSVQSRVEEDTRWAC